MTFELNNGLVAPSDATGTWEQVAWRIGVEVAAPAADDVDRLARFPAEAVEAIRSEKLLSALLPKELDGGGASLVDMVAAVRALAAHCASSALVLAMHSIEVYNIARHGATDALRSLARDISADGLLLANANSEVGVGGDVGRSICALDNTGTPWTLEKHALAISYGENADVILTTARRDPDAAETDQVFIATRRGDFDLEPTSDWDTLGLRGTCSRSFRLTVRVDPELIFPVAFSTIANDGSGQARQLLLSAVWVGLAEAAATKAHAYVRAAARRAVGTMPPSAMRLAEIAADLEAGRSLLVAQALRFGWLESTSDLENAGFTIALRNLKVTTSTLGARTATAALGICGISGYKRDSEFSLDRIIRDAHGGLIMVSNDRYLADNAQLLLARKQI
ncbi:MAG TPA: acyl-CoA dehydrogenase family protein [Acidimicrobiales bacterium]|jgi:acyl-CoA dehydrogenase|nr:acyl-CoA dehydrogenase family protein [Acidimicrobiales bacterium]